MKMCVAKFLVYMAIFVTSITAHTSQSVTECFKIPEIMGKATDLDRCFNDTIIALTLKNTTDLNCKNFDDFNATYRAYNLHVKKSCYNITNATFTEQDATFLNMVKVVMNPVLMNGSQCLINIHDKLHACRGQNLPAANISQSWFRKSNLKFGDFACDTIKKNKNCTMAVIEVNCKLEPIQVETVKSLYDMALKHCRPSIKKPNSSSQLSPLLHLIVILSALTFYK